MTAPRLKLSPREEIDMTLCFTSSKLDGLAELILKDASRDNSMYGIGLILKDFAEALREAKEKLEDLR